MIFDNLKNINRYKGLHKNLDTAIEFIEKTDLNQLSMGKTEIDGNHVFCNVMEANTKDESEVDFEFHKNYMDIQLDLKGSECIHGSNHVMSILSFDKATDFGTAEVKKETSVILEPGNFVGYFPNETHQPTLKAGEKQQIKKCVFKIYMPDFEGK